MEENEKLFTKDEVKEIVQKRLARNKIGNDELQEREASLAERENELKKLQDQMSKRESQIDCKEYLQEQGYPLDYLDILDTTDIEAFKSKADKIFMLSKNQCSSMPMFNGEKSPIKEDVAAKAFSPGFKHKPKEKY